MISNSQNIPADSNNTDTDIKANESNSETVNVDSPEAANKNNAHTSESYTLNHQENLSPDDLEGTSVQSLDPFGLTTRPLLAMLLIFLAGFGLAFTPCILPMLPIIANIVAKQENPSVKSSFILSSSYGLGIATAYGLLGAVIAYLGASVGLLGLMQNPIILLSFATVFVLLGLYLLEIINIRLPSFISQPLNKFSQKSNDSLGSASGSFITGLLSALVVSPCVSAPLSGALIAVSTVGSIPLGFIALFSLGLGLSLPLVLFATTEGKLLPKAGEWMNKVKQGFAYLMFAVALMMLERVIIHPFVLVLWAVWFVVIAVWLWTLSTHIKSFIQWLFKAGAIAILGWSATLIIGAWQGSTNSFSPLNNKEVTAQVAHREDLTNDSLSNEQISSNEDMLPITVTTLAELDKVLATQPKVIVDVMADWCIECKIMEEEIFNSTSSELANAMAGWQLVKVDITETDVNSKAVLHRYNLIGPPTLIYYKQGQLLTKYVGKTELTEFIVLLNNLN